MELRKTSGLLACATVLALALLSGCGSSSDTTSIPPTTTIFNAHTILFRNQTTAVTLGYNGFGQLGIGNLTNQSVATVLPNRPQMDGGSAGGDHTLAFSSTALRTVYAWGSNYHGQIGSAKPTTGSTAFSSTPIAVTLTGGTTGVVTGVAAGAFHSLALMDGNVYSWGYNGFNQLGDRDGAPNNQVDSLTPTLVLDGPAGAPLANIVQIAAGGYFSLARTADGRAYAWGNNIYGQLGQDPTAPNHLTSSTPFQIQTRDNVGIGTTLTNVAQVAAGGSTGYAVTTDGMVLAWGNNSKGQAGQPLTKATVPNPTQVAFPDDTSVSPAVPRVIVSVAAGLDHALALDSHGNVWAWGLNEFNQLGNGLTADSPDPVQVAQLPGTVTKIMAFGNSSLALIGSSWYGWGDNGFGQLGQPASTTTVTKILVPTKVAGF